MRRITNILATEEAGTALRSWRSQHKLSGDRDAALVWVESYANRDGSTVTGFKSGYMLGPLMKEGRDERWTLAQLSDGIDFYVMPSWFHWDARSWYLIEKISGFSMYSIQPVAGR
jgi:hypothetical protein